MSKFRKDFPIFEEEFDPKGIIYLDSAATSLKPKSVISRIVDFYEHETSNVARGNHFLAENNSLAIEDVRSKTASFIKAQSNEIIFTSNATDSVNLVASCLDLKEDDEIIVSLIEHHSNFIPWQQKAKVKIINIDENGLIDLEHLKSLITNKTKLIAISYASNVTGNVEPVKEVIKIAEEKDILTLIDAAQAVSHFSIDIAKLNCDFMAFSSHKMFGPSGVGILYVKKDVQHLLKPTRFGGGMANVVTEEKSTFKEFPYCFEVGTPNIEGILGFGKAIDYINEQGFDAISSYLEELEAYLKKALAKLDFIEILPFHPKHHLPIFTIIPKNRNVNIAFISQMLSDSHKVIVRSGFHCCQLYYNHEKINGGIRISLHIYNTKDDIDRFIGTLEGLKEFC